MKITNVNVKNKHWCDAEDRAVYGLAMQDVRLGDIAVEHGRTPIAIYSRLAKITGLEHSWPPANHDVRITDEDYVSERCWRELAHDVDRRHQMFARM